MLFATIMSSVPMTTDSAAKTSWDEFVDRIKDDPTRTLAALFTAAIVGAILWVKLKGAARIFALIGGFLAGWAAWGIVNRFWSQDSMPLIRLPIFLDFFSLFQGWNRAWLVAPVVAFLVTMAKSKNRSLAVLLVAVLWATLTVIAALLVIQAYRATNEHKEEGSAPAIEAIQSLPQVN